MKSVEQAIEVFLLADNRLVREALAKVLKKKSDIRVVAAFAFEPEITKHIDRIRPNVVILDAAASAIGGLEVVASVRKALPDTKVLMIGMEPNKTTFFDSVRAGVSGYLLKDASAAEIAAAVRSITLEEAACPPKLCLMLFDYVAQQCQPSGVYGKAQPRLSRREQQLVQMIGGLSNKEIAMQLNLSEATIKNHVHRILRKLGVNDRLSATQYCREEGLPV